MTLAFDTSRGRGLSCTEVAVRLKVSVPALARLIASGRFPSADMVAGGQAAWSEPVVVLHPVELR